MKTAAIIFSVTASTVGGNSDGGSDTAHTPSKIRDIPEKVLIGYASHNYDNVRKAVMEDGVNIVIWAFIEIVSSGDGSVEEIKVGEGDYHQPTLMSRQRALNNNSTRPRGEVRTGLDLESIKRLMEELDAKGYSHVLHLASFGGWNGPHLDQSLDAEEWYMAWEKSAASDTFHGVDWDLEGNDEVTSANNVFTLDCLDKMGEISRLMVKEGYVVTMAPPQSYLNFSSSNFSRYVNLTDPVRGWHGDFHYYGNNVYAYLLANYGDCCIDLVSVQMYESYSDAAMAVYDGGMAAGDYLVGFVRDLANRNQTFVVDFSGDPELGHAGARPVGMPLSKLVIGLANGWAAEEAGDKIFYASGAECREAYLELRGSGTRDLTPRGFMFWTIEERGAGEVYLGREIGEFLHGDKDK